MAEKLRIMAMPGICDAIDFGLSNEEENRRQAQSYLKNLVEVYWETTTHLFFRTGNWENGGRIILFNKKTGFISYLVKFEVNYKKLTNFNKSITQTNVWRYNLDPKAKGLASYVFFEILLQKYGAVLSDSIQTRDGKKFWEQLMAEADDKNLGIAMVDFNRHQIYPKESNVSIDSWIPSWNTWHRELKHLGERFLIFNP